MKNLFLTMSVVFLFTATTNAQEPKQKKKVKTEKSCSVNGKKCCGESNKKEASCDSKKTEKK
ncbi:MAG: hypothetical protein KA210_03505 [Bacteroidia bacterium]|jgi:hypothetical protein|uniref:hypothetical protein n=1 Tax=Flavobacterium sp. TaxID=239 RepID=UPI001B7251BA|nr:hypothetical protein [Bacteroidia bacterium]